MFLKFMIKAPSMTVIKNFSFFFVLYLTPFGKPEGQGITTKTIRNSLYHLNSFLFPKHP